MKRLGRYEQALADSVRFQATDEVAVAPPLAARAEADPSPKRRYMRLRYPHTWWGRKPRSPLQKQIEELR
jgi:hypothetical protein